MDLTESTVFASYFTRRVSGGSIRVARRAGSQTNTAAARLSFHRHVIDGLRGLPGVITAAATTSMALTGALRYSDHVLERVSDMAPVLR